MSQIGLTKTMYETEAESFEGRNHKDKQKHAQVTGLVKINYN